MTHISGHLEWTEAIFNGHKEGDDGLIIFLSDGSTRKMNYENWENSYPQTLLNILNIKCGSAIRFATWNGYRKDLWFCDVELI